MNSKPINFRSLGDEIRGALFTPESDEPSPALIICHGAGEFKENYFEMCQALAEHGVGSLVMDMHGHGESGGERYCVRMHEWVSDIQAAIDFLATRPEIDKHRIGAFGLSSGGTAILEAAVLDLRLRVLIALDATVRNSLAFPLTCFLKFLVLLGKIKKVCLGSEWRVPLAKMSGEFHLASDPKVQQDLLADPRALAAFMNFPFPGGGEAFFVDTLKRVSRIKAPTLVLWGEEDKLDPPESGRLLHNALTCEKELHIIPGNGHVGHLDRNKDTVFALTVDWARKKMAR